MLNFLLVSKELFQLAHGWRAYVRHWENWLQLLIVLSVFLCAVPFDQVRASPHRSTGERKESVAGSDCHPKTPSGGNKTGRDGLLGGGVLSVSLGFP